MPQTRRLVGVTLAGTVLAVAVCSCDDATSPRTAATPAGTPAAAGPSALDPCLVGTWRATGISGSFSVGGAQVKLAGGAGEILAISATGAIRTDDSNSAPVGGTTPDGSDYRLVQTGTATGTISSTDGRIKVNLDQPTTLTVSLYKNGNRLESQHPGSASDTYSCSARTSLVITGGGGTVTRYVPG